MAQDEPYKATNGYSQPTMTSPPATSPMDYDKFGEAGRILFSLAEENKELRNLAAQAEDFKKYKNLYTNKCVECDSLKEENKLLKEENRLLKQQGNGASHPKFQYIFDTTDFNERMEAEDIEHLMDILLELAETPLPRGYLIETSMDIVPIYIMLAERNTFNKHGKSDVDSRNWGIVPFCDCWNNNVVPRIADDKRREELFCDSSKIKGALSKEPWKESASCSWNRLYESCDNSNGRNAKKKAKLDRAINIKMRLEKLLEQIPSLKSKKY